MMNNALRGLLGVALALGLSTALLAKGPTSRITISGADLNHPVEITDPNSVKDFQVWSGPGTVSCVKDNCVEGTRGFIAEWSSGAVIQKPDGLQRYEVSFYATDARTPNQRRTEHLVYVVFYEYDPSTSEGYVYLPGKGEHWYKLNARSIYRGREGRWFRATPAWQTLVVPLIARR